MPNLTTSSLRVCPNCDGFPVVAITTGTRLSNGARATLRVICPACQGTGNAPAKRPARVLVTAGASC